MSSERPKLHSSAFFLDVGGAGNEVQVHQVLGFAKRSFISGIRLCPPASSLASSPSWASMVAASFSELAR